VERRRLSAGGLSVVRAQDELPAATEQQIWTCNYIATSQQGPLQIMSKFQVFGEELAEIETVPKGLNFRSTKFSDHPPPGIGAAVIMLVSAVRSILGLRTGDPTLGHCDSQ
jgi:hypothetical protein